MTTELDHTGVGAASLSSTTSQVSKRTIAISHAQHKSVSQLLLSLMAEHDVTASRSALYELAMKLFLEQHDIAAILNLIAVNNIRARRAREPQKRRRDDV